MNAATPRSPSSWAMRDEWAGAGAVAAALLIDCFPPYSERYNRMLGKDQSPPQYPPAPAATGRRARQCLYASAMNRIFLALLALFAGLATQVAPAAARLGGQTEIGALASQRSSAQQVAVRTAVTAPRATPITLAAAKQGEPLAAPAAPAARAVLIRIDRTRE